MEDKMYELGLPAVKSENNSSEKIPNADNSFTVIDALNKNISEANYPVYLEENTKTVSDMQTYIALDSTTEEIQPDDAQEENTENVSGEQSYIALDSTTEEIQPDDALEENTKNVSVEQSYIALDSKTEEIQPDDDLEENTKYVSDEQSYIALDSTTEEIQPDAALEENTKNFSDEQQDLKVLSHDGEEIENMKKNIIQTYERTITLTEEILAERRSQTYQMQSSASCSNSEKKTAPGQSGLEKEVRSKTEAIPSDIIARKKEKEHLNETVCELEVKLGEAILKTINWADVHEEGAGNETKLLESIPTSTDLSITSHHKDEHMPDLIALREMVVGASERVKTDILYDFEKLLEKVIEDALYIDEKCREFLCDLRDTLDVNIRINKEKLFKIEIVDFKEIVMKLEQTGMESCSFLERVLELPISNLAINLSLKKKLRESIERVYMINSNLTRSFKMIIDKLRAINDRLVIEGFQEASVRYMMVDFLEIIKIMNKITHKMQNAIQCIDKILLSQ